MANLQLVFGTSAAMNGSSLGISLVGQPCLVFSCVKQLRNSVRM